MLRVNLTNAELNFPRHAVRSLALKGQFSPDGCTAGRQNTSVRLERGNRERVTDLSSAV